MHNITFERDAPKRRAPQLYVRLQMPRAHFISTEGPYLEAQIEIDGQRYYVMDEFSVDERSIPAQGAEINFEFSPLLDDNDSWESIFSGNPDNKIGLEQMSGWKYRAYGKIVSIKPVVVDCGLLKIEEVINSNDPNVIGESVAFTISRLGGYVYAI